MTYDAENRLKTAEYTDGGSEVHRTEYYYNGYGLLTEMKKYQNGALQSDTRYVRSGFLPVQERDGNNLVTREYTWGLNYGGGIGGLLNLKQGGLDYSYLFDGKGNVAALLNSAQAIVATYAYDPFGVLMNKTGTLNQPYMFSTKEYDSETGLSYYGYRYYNVSIGKWITRDPIGERGGINLYEFVGNNPVNWFDPLGLMGFSIGLEGAASGIGFGGVGGFYANFSHDPSRPWYSGWSSSVTLVLGGGAAASVYGLTGGVLATVNNSCNVRQLNGPFLNAGRLGWVSFSWRLPEPR